MTTAVVGADVDSTAATEADQAGPTRRRVATPSMGAGERKRVVDVVIGEYEYDARCPKLVVWTDMAQIIEQQRGNRSERRRAGDQAPAAEGRVTTDRIRLTQAVSHFLRGCLSAADWDAIDVDLANPDSELDLPDLWASGLKLIIEFRPDMEAMAASIGMKVPGVLDQLADKIDENGRLKPDEPEPAPTARKAPARKAAGRKAR